MSAELVRHGVFSVQGDPDEQGRIYVMVDGLGMVLINRTSEGLIVDIYDETPENNCLATVGLEDWAFTDDPEAT